MWLLLLGCGEPPEPAQAPEADVVEQDEPAVEVVPAAPPDEVAARHILVSHREAATNPNARSKSEALTRAEDIRARIVAGEDMRELAFTMSDDMGTRPRGGFLGIGDDGAWVPAFEQAAFALQVGELSQPVESPFGYHVIRREDHTPVEINHLVVRYEGSPGMGDNAPPERTLAEAEARAAEARARIVAGEDFADIAKELSDGPYAYSGGQLGVFLRGELGPEVDAIIDDIAPGELSEVYTTVHGAHVILRVE